VFWFVCWGVLVGLGLRRMDCEPQQESSKEECQLMMGMSSSTSVSGS